MEFREPKGIYLQIADRIRERILRGEWQAGQRIPSIRELAVELGVNPNTVTRSYRKLLDRGLISNQRGRGYFVSEDAARIALRQMKDEFMREEVPRILRVMKLLGIEADELAERMSDSGRSESKREQTP